MKNFLLNFILFSLIVPLSYGQTNLLEGQSTSFKITVKKYEILQTEIRTIENQLVYANMDLTLVGEQTGNIDLEKFKSKLEKDTNVPTNQFLQVNRPSSESIILVKDNSIKTDSRFALTSEERGSNNKKFNIGYPNHQPVNTYTNLATLSLPENRSITDLSGYIPVVSYGLKLK